MFNGIEIKNRKACTIVQNKRNMVLNSNISFNTKLFYQRNSDTFSVLFF